MKEISKEAIKAKVDQLMNDWGLEGLVMYAEGKDGCMVNIHHGTTHIGTICENAVTVFMESLKDKGVGAGEASEQLSSLCAYVLMKTFGFGAVSDMEKSLEKQKEEMKNA